MHVAVALMIIVILSSTPAMVSSQSGERSTSIIDLRYSTEPLYNVETPWAEVTVAYQNSPTGWYLAIDVIDLAVLEARRGTSWFGDINKITGKETMQTWVDDSRAGLVKGTVAGTPIECGKDFPVSGGSMPMTVKGYTWCVLAIGGSAQPIYLSGQENVRFELADLTPGTWRLRVLAGLYLTRGGGFGPALETFSFKDISIAVVTAAGTTSSQIITTVTGTTSAEPSTESERPQTATSIAPPSTVQPSWETGWTALILAIVILLIAVALIWRSRPRPKKTAAQIFCPDCGAPNPTTYEYCGKCGHKLKQ